METTAPTLAEIMAFVSASPGAEEQSGTTSRPTTKRESVNDLLDETKAAAVLGDVKPGTLSVWRSTGRYKIPYIKIGRRVRYRRGDLLAWLESRTRANGATA